MEYVELLDVDHFRFLTLHTEIPSLYVLNLIEHSSLQNIEFAICSKTKFQFTLHVQRHKIRSFRTKVHIHPILIRPFKNKPSKYGSGMSCWYIFFIKIYWMLVISKAYILSSISNKISQENQQTESQYNNLIKQRFLATNSYR